MLQNIKKFEKMIIFSLVVMMALVLFLSTLELAWIIMKDILSPPFRRATHGGIAIAGVNLYLINNTQTDERSIFPLTSF